jgi:heavy metal sensor kinase
MKPQSLHFRLTAWYTLIFSAVMAVVFAAFYFLTRQSLLSHTDTAIAAHNEKIAAVLLEENFPTNRSFTPDNQILTRQFSEMPGMLLIVSNPSGQIRYQSQELGSSQKVIGELLENFSPLTEPVFLNRRVGSSLLRLGLYPVQRDGQLLAIILMGHPMDVIQKSLNALFLTLLLVYFGLLGLAGAGGLLMARQALNPITQISQQLKKISAENLKERVPQYPTGDEIEELAHTFNHLLDRLDEAFARERQFISDIAHELKTPIAILKSEIEVAVSKDRPKQEYQKALKEILSDVNRLSAMIKNLLDLAWIEAENPNFEKNQFNLSAALTELGDIAAKLAGQKHLRFKSQLRKGVIISGAENKISRAVFNILDNAIKYTPAGGTVTLSLYQKGGNAVIKIKDTGVGIPQTEQKKIFERFYRGSLTAKTPGSGLGLAIAKGIIAAHQGTLRVISQRGKGTTATITLPF